MTQLSNIILPANHVLDPDLVPLINKLALDKPNWVFGLRSKKSIDAHSYPRTLRSVHGGVRITDPDVNYCRALNVYESGSPVKMGTIGVEHQYTTRSSQQFKYYLNTWRLDNKRSSTISSIKMENIAREAKRILRSKDAKELLDEGVKDLSSSWWKTITEITRPLTNGRLVKSIAALQTYAFCVANGRDVDTQMFQSLLDELRSPQCEKVVAEYELGKHMDGLKDAGKTTDMVVDSDHYIFKKPDSEEVVSLSFDELPVAWQERVAVLQILKDNELVRDIGYRLNGRLYRIVT